MSFLRILTLHVLLFTLYSVNGQELAIGHAFPETIPLKVVNYVTPTLRLSDFRGKLLILDFWSTTCSSCLHEFRKIDSLQRFFTGKVQFILITKEPDETVTRFFQKMPHLLKPDVPLITGDTVLSRFFPFLFVPHHVWLDQSGLVHAITYSENATVARIKQALDGKNIILARKKDSLIQENPASEFALAQLAVAHDKLVYSSYITGYINGIHSSEEVERVDEGGKSNRIEANNASVLMLYKIAYGQWLKYQFMQHSNSVILDLKNPEAYLQPEDINQYDQWNVAHKFSYKLILPASESKNMFVLMQQDLNRNFGLNARIEKRKIQCFVLVDSKTVKTKRILPGRALSHAVDSANHKQVMSFKTLKWLIQTRFDNEATPQPFVSESTYSNDALLTLEPEQWNAWTPQELVPLQQAIGQYGLHIVEKKRLTNVLIISDKTLQSKSKIKR